MKKLTENVLIKEGWIKARMKSGKVEWLWREGVQIYRMTLDEAKEVMRKAYPGVYS